MNPKRTWVNEDADLAATVKMSIDTHANSVTAVILTFDCYSNISLKQATRKSRKGERARRVFHI